MGTIRAADVPREDLNALCALIKSMPEGSGSIPTGDYPNKSCQINIRDVTHLNVTGKHLTPR